MKWGNDQDTDLHGDFRRLIAQRQQRAVLQSGARRVLHLDAKSDTVEEDDDHT